MKRFLSARCKMIMLMPLLLPGFLAAPGCSSAPANDGSDAEIAAFLIANGGPSHFAVTGTNEDFGRYMAIGEVNFVDGGQGTGVAVLGAEGGDKIVADVTILLHTDETADFTFHWRDSVTFTDGSVLSSTGLFATSKPPGLALLGTSLRHDSCCVLTSCTSKCPP
jgi:hypothetical protein